eukprot:scaffold808_cov196-Alexandrium_tamarense.AAC.102
MELFGVRCSCSASSMGVPRNIVMGKIKWFNRGSRTRRRDSAEEFFRFCDLSWDIAAQGLGKFPLR